MLNGFCLLSTLQPLFLTDNIKLDGIPTKIKQKYIPFLSCISNFEGESYKNVKDKATSSFISCCFMLHFTLADIVFHKFLEYHC